MLIAAVIGGIIMLVPALLKVKLGASEMVTSLMLNYVASLWLSYLVFGPWRDPARPGLRLPHSFSSPRARAGWHVVAAIAS